jgi:hypothetical protein
MSPIAWIAFGLFVVFVATRSGTGTAQRVRVRIEDKKP